MNILDNELLCVDDVLLEPKLGLLRSRSEAVLKPFIYSAPMDTVSGLEFCQELLSLAETPVLCRNLPIEEYTSGVLYLANTSGFIALGSGKEELLNFMKLIQKLQSQGLIKEDTKFNIAIDIAHGDSINGHETAAFLREYSFVDKIMSGSIATPAAAIRSLEAGCTHLRVGIGCGAACQTRVQTGIGVPQLSAVYLIARELKRQDKYQNYTIIADGGIDSPGKAVKYLAAGADAVMMGNVFSRTLESYGWKKHLGRLYKSYRGHASKDFMTEHNKNNKCPEGVASSAFYWSNLTVKDVVDEYRGGVSSAISYLGLTSMDEISPENVSFLKITHATQIEGLPSVK